MFIIHWVHARIQSSNPIISPSPRSRSLVTWFFSLSLAYLFIDIMVQLALAVNLPAYLWNAGGNPQRQRQLGLGLNLSTWSYEIIMLNAMSPCHPTQFHPIHKAHLNEWRHPRYAKYTWSKVDNPDRKCIPIWNISSYIQYFT